MRNAERKERGKKFIKTLYCICLHKFLATALMSKEWEYGGVYKKYPELSEGKEIKIGTGIIKTHNIFDELPAFMKKADLLFIIYVI